MTRLARSAVGDLVIELDRTLLPGELRATLARALGDPSLELLYALDGQERWVDPDGRPAPRILEAGDAERRRVERNLHDGAQQRMATLALSLAMLRDRMRGDQAAAASLDQAAAELKMAIGELRELEDRVSAVRGTFRVLDAPGGGTRILAEIPCDT